MPQIYGLVNRALPTAAADGVAAQAREDRYGSPIVVPVTTGTYALADEGSYFKCINATPGTAITDAVRTAFSATAGLFSIRNTDVGGGKRLYMDYLKLLVKTVPASATSVEVLVAIDNITRYSSGGTPITTLSNVNMDSTRTSVAVVHFGVLTLAAESASVRRIVRSTLRGDIPVVDDTLVFQFGSVDAPGFSGGTVPGSLVDAVGPAIIGPSHSMTVHVWYPGNATTAAQYEFEAGYWER